MFQPSLQSAETPFASAYRSEPGGTAWLVSAPSPVTRLLVWLWRPLKWFWITLLLSWLAASLVTLLVTEGQTGTPDLPVVQLALEQPWLVGAVLGAVALLTLAAFLAQRSRPGSPYLPSRVESLGDSVGQFIPRYLKQFYLYRVADAEAREALRAAASRASDEEPSGICVLGPAMMGKTRLAWEAIQTELYDWTLVRWPYDAPLPFDLAALRGARVVFWLDDLAKYAHLSLAPTLNDLPRRLKAVDAQFVIVATCRDGAELQRAAAHLAPLLEHLIPVRPAEIGENEIAWHTAALKYHGIKLRADQFNGTPGSVVLEAARMAQERFPALPKSAQRVLRAMKLLRSAGIYSYAEQRVRATVEDVFQMPPHEWRRARNALVRERFIRLEAAPAGKERLLVPIADVYLGDGVPDYTPPGVEISDGWRELEKSLTRRQDADGLNQLGLAFLERRTGNMLVNKLHAEACFRAALAGYRQRGAHASWAIAQHHLALTHWHQAQMAEASERGVLLAQAKAAYRMALRVAQWEDIPLYWALMQQHLGAALSQQATLTEGAERAGLHAQAVEALQDARGLYERSLMKDAGARTHEDLGVALSDQAHLAEGAERAALLGQAIAAYRAALEIYAREAPRTNWARTQNNLGIALMQQAELAEGTARAALLNEARAAHEAALEVYTPAGTPDHWAGTQCNLGNVLRHQAEQAEGAEGAALLAQAVAAYRTALQVCPREDAPDAWAMTQNNLGNALSDQAELEQGNARAALLNQAASAHRAALSVYTRAYLPVEWAGTHLNLAQVYFARALALKGGQKVKRQALARAQDAIMEALSVFSSDTAPTYHEAAIRLYDEIEAALQALGSGSDVYASA
jgi:tetratricopeptide (TPR) repeat protein